MAEGQCHWRFRMDSLGSHSAVRSPWRWAPVWPRKLPGYLGPRIKRKSRQFLPAPSQDSRSYVKQEIESLIEVIEAGT
jgi:hypothetical protein